jgi:hypothetical protein
MSAPSFSLLSRFAEIETAQTTLRKAAIIATIRTGVEDVFHLYTIRDDPELPRVQFGWPDRDPAIRILSSISPGLANARPGISLK